MRDVEFALRQRHGLVIENASVLLVGSLAMDANAAMIADAIAPAIRQRDELRAERAERDAADLAPQAGEGR